MQTLGKKAIHQTLVEKKKLSNRSRPHQSDPPPSLSARRLCTPEDHNCLAERTPIIEIDRLPLPDNSDILHSTIPSGWHTAEARHWVHLPYRITSDS